MTKYVLAILILIAVVPAIRIAAADTPTPAATGAAPPPPDANAGPEQIVRDSAQRMLAELDANRPMYRKDPSKLDHLVATVLLPSFDTEASARLVLGPTWRTASAEQRQRFVDAFYHSLLRNYGAALVDFTGDRFKVLPYRGDPADTKASVRTEVTRENGDTIPVIFELHKTDTGWKAWDVVIDGISYVKSFRTDIGAEVQAKGLDEVIARLESQGIAPKPGGGGPT
jgi:phospholipid transport system substrate-binding protein